MPSSCSSPPGQWSRMISTSQSNTADPSCLSTPQQPVGFRPKQHDLDDIAPAVSAAASLFMPWTPLGDIVVIPTENEASLWRPGATSQNVVKRIKVPAHVYPGTMRELT